MLAQDPQLFEDTWYLQKLTIDGEEIITPQLEEVVEETTFDEMNELFSTGYCDFYNAEINFNNSVDNFTINSIVYLSGFPCFEIESAEFDSKYRGYFSDEITFNNPFFYEITNSNGIRYLEFTNSNGDNALYANQLLAIVDNKTISATIYPNPTTSKVNVLLEEAFNSEASLNILDITGKEVYRTTMVSNETEIKIDILKAGVYFLNVVMDQGKIAIFKIIKK